MAKAGTKKQFATKYLKRELPTQRIDYPRGWMSPTDMQVLFNVSCDNDGPVLEVGPWVGRSTTAIALGLRQRKREGLPYAEFDTIDLGITSAQEWQQKLKEKLDPDRNAGQIASTIYHPGGSLAVLINNMKERNLLPFITTFTRGDIVEYPSARQYKMIFCDTTHSDYEVHRNVPVLAKMAAPGCTYVFDDVITEQRQDLICGYLDAKKVYQTRLCAEDPTYCKLLIVET